ncbi:Lipoprotein signal peptidase [uncultured Candidatus Thioglobus sp.]|nr:Lipoprotein signal peptidase [uncultured Candidatus Thioglobus sp.]
MLIKHKNYFLLTVFLILTDQLSKWLAYEYLGVFSKQINSFLSLTFAQNYGAAFSLLAQQDGWQRYFLSGISAAASIAIIIWMFRTPAKNTLKLSALMLILSGALGNMIDRVYNGFVIDFIHVHYNTWSFPIFNLADSFISVGVVLLLLADRK